MKNRKRVLVVGDQSDTGEAGILVSAGYDVKSVSSIEEAIDALALYHYDKVIINPADIQSVLVASADAAECVKLALELQWQLSVMDVVANSTEADIAYLDSNFNFIWVNSAYADHSGYAREDLIGCNHFELFPNEENQQIFEMVRDTGKPYVAKEKPFEYVSQPERGITYWNWTIVPIKRRSDPNGATEGLTLTLVDVTEDVRARLEIEQLRDDAEQRASEVEAIMSSMADGVIFVDLRGNLTWINQAGRKILAMSEGESLEGWSDRYHRFRLNGEPMSVEDTAASQAMRGEVVKDTRYRLITPWGHEVILSASAAPVHDASGKIIGATSVFQDVSQRVEFEKKQNDLLKRERRIAEMLQQALIPPEDAYNIDGCRVAVKYQPALIEAEVGGDFYDVFEVSAGKIGVLIGDVAGKGLPAAIRVAAARYAIRSYAYLDSSPGKVLTLANEALSKEAANGNSMLTAFFAVLDVQSGIVTYSNGGHEPPVILGADGDIYEPELLGRALGILGNYNYGEATLELKPGDAFIIVTDGITEARPSPTDLFGKEGIIKYLQENRGISLDEIPEGLLEAAKSYAGGSLQDDVAIVAFELVDTEA